MGLVLAARERKEREWKMGFRISGFVVVGFPDVKGRVWDEGEE
jgi:hypothetical protein